jgi:hypothetical protein
LPLTIKCHSIGIKNYAIAFAYVSADQPEPPGFEF